MLAARIQEREVSVVPRLPYASGMLRRVVCAIGYRACSAPTCTGSPASSAKATLRILRRAGPMTGSNGTSRHRLDRITPYNADYGCLLIRQVIVASVAHIARSCVARSDAIDAGLANKCLAG